MIKKALCAIISALTLCASFVAQAETEFPNQMIKLVVPYPPGGLLDNVARILSPKLRESLGQPIVVDNRAGGGAVIGADMVAKSKPDGYTLLFGGFGPNAVNASILASVPYNAASDFAPVIEVFRTAHVLVVGNQVEATSLRELTEYAGRPGVRLTVATAGPGSATHLFAELYRLAVNVELNIIPYRGDAPAITAVLGGQVQAYFASAMTILPYVQSGKLRALAVTGKQRIAALPGVPTLAEAGVPNYEATAWYGLYAPAGTPPSVIAKLNRHINVALQQPEVRQALIASGGVDLVGGSPEQLRTQTNTEIARWREVAKSANLRMP